MVESLVHQLMTPIGKAKTRVKLLLLSTENKELLDELQKILSDLDLLEELVQKNQEIS